MITLPNILILLAYFAVSVVGLTLLKISNGQLISFNGIAGFFFYGLGFLIWYVILTRLSMSIAFPVAAGGLVVFTQIVGYYFFKEQIGLSHIIGIALIVIGITLVTANKGSL